MPVVRINLLKEGVTLHQDVKNLNGQLLIRKGMKLTDRHLQMLKSWGVTEVDVVAVAADVASSPGGSESDVEKDQREAKAAATAELLRLFYLNNLKNPVMAELFDLCVARKAKLPW